MKKIRAGKKYASVLISAALSFFFVFLTVYSASTIGTNITTGGTLAVSGGSAFTGNVTASGTLQVTGESRFYGPVTFETGIGASSTALFAGTLRASSTFQSTGAARFYDPVTFVSGIGASSTALFAGTLRASSTFQSTGAARFYDPVTFVAGIGASSTASFAGTTTVATSTPAQELSVQGDAMLGATDTNATTTLVIDGLGGRAGCIQLRAADGSMVRIYASSSPPANNGPDENRRSNGANLVVEAGMCQFQN